MGKYFEIKNEDQKKLIYKIVLTGCFLIMSIFLTEKSAWSTSDDFNSMGIRDEKNYTDLQNGVQYQIPFLNMVENISEMDCFFRHPQDGKGKITISIASSTGEIVHDEYTFCLKNFEDEILRFPFYINSGAMEFGKSYVFYVKVTERENLLPVEMQCATSSASLAKGRGYGGSFIPYFTFSGTSFFMWKNIGIMFAASLALIGIFWLFPVIVFDQMILKEIMDMLWAVWGYVSIEIVLGNLFDVSLDAALVNITYIYVFEKLIETFFTKQRVAQACVMLFCIFVGTAEYYVLEFRGTPITPWDLKVMNTAVTVAGAYHFDIPLKLALGIDFVLLGFVVNTKIRYNEKRKKRQIRINNGVIDAVGMLIIGFAIYPTINIVEWDQKSSYQEKGFIAAFIANTKFLNYKKPQNYDKKAVELLCQNTTPVYTEVQTQASNIIVIMDESFSDLRVINEQFVSDDYMPFIDSLSENTVRGNLYVPVFGNGTCDTEFEVLTEVSTAYTGAYPYVTRISSSVESLASILKEDGYETLAFHPYLKENWNRSYAYPKLGFDVFYDGDSVADGQQMRWVISDAADFQKVIDLYETKEEDKLFVFNVTMQNHGGYEETWDNFTNTVDLSKQGEFPQAEQYFSLIKETDKALEQLIAYFEKVNEPTLICFFGDHQPNLDEGYYEMLFGKSLDQLTAQETILRYQTPFLIWTNYEIQGQKIDALSANYLAANILYYAGYDLNGYEAFTYDLSKKYPVLSKMGIIDAEGNLYTEGVDSKAVNDYEMLNYYRMHQYQ